MLALRLRSPQSCATIAPKVATFAERVHGTREKPMLTEESQPNQTGGKHSFDELAKGLATGSVSRRQVLRLFGGAVLGGLMASIPGVALAQKTGGPPPGGGGPPPGGETSHCAPPCPAGQTCCDGVCVNLSTDPLNCGACGHQCTGGTGEGRCCSNGECVQFGETGPPPGAVCLCDPELPNNCPEEADQVCCPTPVSPQGGICRATC